MTVFPKRPEARRPHAVAAGPPGAVVRVPTALAYPVEMRVLAIFAAVGGWGAAVLIADRLISSAPKSLMVTNYRGRRIPAIGGAVLLLSLLACGGIFSLLAVLAPLVTGFHGAPVRNQVVHLGIMTIAAGFFGLGLLDDISDGTGAKGLGGHLGALKQGIVTSGMIKAVGGLALAFFTSALWELRFGPAIIGALIISGSANLLNLLDLRPGRACKFFLLAFIPLALAGAVRAPSFLPLSAGLAGAAAGWLRNDLSEKGILGDSGSNMLGGVIGAGIVLAAGPGSQVVVLVVLLLLTLASERYSFSRAIAGFRPLRWFDDLGRPRK